MTSKGELLRLGFNDPESAFGTVEGLGSAIDELLAKNCTDVTVPSLSPAVADTVMLAPAVNVAPSAGALRATVGATWATPSASKNSPPMTAFAPAVQVTRNRTFPAILQTTYCPFTKPVIE